MEASKKVTIMDIDFLNMTQKDFLELYIEPHLHQQEKCFIVTANPEIVMRTREDASYKEIVQSADYIVPDGVGILLAAKYMKQPLQERIPGFDVMVDLLAFANEEKMSCYFLGAEEAVNDRAVREVKKRFPNLDLAGHHHGFFDINDKQVAESVKQSNPDIIFVALGFPRQEEWITTYMDDFSKGVFIGVGGSFDVLAGEVKRAPAGWIKLNLEWLYRLLQQPFRIKRTFKLFEFMMRVILKKGK